MTLKTYKVKNIRRISWVKLWLLLTIILSVFSIIIGSTAIGIQHNMIFPALFFFLFPMLEFIWIGIMSLFSFIHLSIFTSLFETSNLFLIVGACVIFVLINSIVVATILTAFMKLFAYLFNVNLLLKMKQERKNVSHNRENS